VCRNHCLNHLEKKSTAAVTAVSNDYFDQEMAVTFCPEPAIHANELYQKIDSVMKTKPVLYRQMAFLYFYEELKYHEIARILKTPVGTVKSRVHLIKKELRQNLEEYK
jgi:RNA polymerase sigma factor (sigma-70 family)